MEEKVAIKLTDWEVANFHLPSVTTITLYEGKVTVEFLRSRLVLILQKNPWYRIVNEMSKKAVPSV